MLNFPPLNSGDIQLYTDGDVHKLTAEDWPDTTHKLLLFIPQTDEEAKQDLIRLSDYLIPFEDLNCDVFVSSSEQIHTLRDFVENELQDPHIKALSSYILPTRIGIMINGRSRRSTIFVTKEGDTTRIEHAEGVSRSLSDLHRMVYAHVNHSFLAEGWVDPVDAIE